MVRKQGYLLRPEALKFFFKDNWTLIIRNYLMTLIERTSRVTVSTAGTRV